MSYSVDESLIASLNNALVVVFRYGGIFTFVFGNIGNVLNCLILSQGALRANSCAWFFLISSIANLIFIVTGLTARMLSGWVIDPANTTLWFCKFRTFILFTSRTIGLWLIMLATVDRWLSSSSNARYRRMSTLKNAYRSIILVVSLSALLYAQLLHCNQINLTNSPLKCYAYNTLCRTITDYSDICITVMMPIIMMMVFGMLTIFNVRRTQRRLLPLHMSNMISTHPITVGQTGVHQQRMKKTDRHLLKMLLFQVIVIIVLSFPFCILRTYSTLTSPYQKSPLQTAIDNFVFNFTLLLSYVSAAVPFYIYTLCGGRVFGNALLNIWKSIERMLKCEHR